jgi:D-amino-acid oxidase
MPPGSYRVLSKEELQHRFAKVYNITVPLIETRIFLPWLQNQLQEAGVDFRQMEIINFDELKLKYDLLVNCTALGARKLCNDESVIPVRGGRWPC